MFKKVGDLSPITIIDPLELDDEATKKALKNAIHVIEKQNSTPEKIENGSEKN